MAVEIQKQLLEALKKIDRPGTFCTSGLLPPMVAGLEVEGIGAVALPLGKRDAAALKKQARQAPYGKGVKTVVDTYVRRVWEIDAEQVALTNPQWSTVLDQLMRTVQTELGLEKQKLDAHLYKLLLYEKGSFFLPHRDGEKLDRMVATLVIALPTFHEGGQLIVRHDGREETIDFGPESQFQTQFAAFYADCEHEIRPVTSGFRIALVYNLVLAKAGRAIKAPTSSPYIAAVTGVLEKWKAEREQADRSDATKTGDGQSKLAVLLEHEYSQEGLTYDALKGVDRVRAEVLFAAARETACDASLALVTQWESGSAEPTGDYGYRGRRRRHYYDDDSDDFDEAGEHIMGEVFDESLSAEHFSDAEGHSLAFGEIPLSQREIVAETPLNAGQPFKEDFEGYTGNAGMTLERWYHRAAVLLWPVGSRFDVLCENGVQTAVGGLEPMVQLWKKAKKSDKAALQQQCLDFASRIITNWPPREFTYGYVPKATSTDCLIGLLETLGDVSLIAAWLRGVMAKDVSIEPGEILGNICEQHGWLTFQKELQQLFQGSSNETLQRNARLLADWSLRKGKNADRQALCRELAGRIMSALESWAPQKKDQHWQARPLNLVELLPLLLQSFIAVNEPELSKRMVNYVLERPKEFDLTTVQIPAMLYLSAWFKKSVKAVNPAVQRWLQAIRDELETRAAHPPQEPKDWRREPAKDCKCADCRQLNLFLQDPNTETLRMPLAKQRRQHLHGVVDSNKLDTSHQTERRGSPYTLVFTKTKASYSQALEAHQIDLNHLAKARSLLEWHEGLPKK